MSIITMSIITIHKKNVLLDIESISMFISGMVIKWSVLYSFLQVNVRCMIFYFLYFKYNMLYSLRLLLRFRSFSREDSSRFINRLIGLVGLIILSVLLPSDLLKDKPTKSKQCYSVNNGSFFTWIYYLSIWIISC